ncbi:MAG: non-homologous end-joining DNA ligase [Candidatus Aenigmatarchaeota archaeon]
MTLFEQIIKPMLAEISKPFNSEEFCFEVKLDGTRTIAYIDKEKKEVRFLNRRLKWFQSNYPELQKIYENINANKVVIDGEIVVFKEGKPDFTALQTREHVDEKLRIKLLSEIMPATYVVFDILHLDGEDLIDKPLIERKKILEKVVKEDKRIMLSSYIIGRGEELFEKAREKGLEGIMAKRLDSKYEIGKRSKNWLKIKFLKTLDCVIVGYTKGEGWREKYFGALVLACFHKGKLKYVGRCGTGLDEKGYAELTEELKKLKIDRCPLEEKPKLPSDLEVSWVEPKLICEVKFMEITKDLQLRAPAFVRLRNDKNLEDCILEI